MRKLVSLMLLMFFIQHNAFAQRKNNKFRVIAYYTGDSALINQYKIGQLDQIIFSFCHLKGNELHVDKMKDSITIRHLVSLKRQYPKLKVLLSMGGWSACGSCSEVFSNPEGRQQFANSTKHLLTYFGADGLDLDWEYPAIEGYPGHLFQAVDRQNFTSLIQLLRKTLGKKYQLSFAAGGFQQYIDSSVEWHKVIPLVNNVNIMSYDLVSGYSSVTGHQTPLYSTNKKEESLDKAITQLLGLGIPARKIIMGGAFYTKAWKVVSVKNDGLYQNGHSTHGVDFKRYDSVLTLANGWQYHWDEKAQAPYWYNAKDSLFATGDDIRSIKAKTAYGLTRKLGGIMFWELPLDKPQGGMVQAIVDEIKEKDGK